MKKLILGLLGLTGLLLITALLLPFVVNLNQFKPQIKAVVSDAVNGEIDFSSAKLTILSGLGVKLEGVSFKNTDETFSGTKLFQVKELMLRANLVPMLQGNFEGELYIDAPEITIVNKGARNNIAALTKPTNSTQATASSEESAVKEMTPEEKQKQEEMIEEFKKRISIKSIRIKTAQFKLQNLYLGEHYDVVNVSDLNVLIEDIGLERDIKTTITTNVEFSDKGIFVKGPVETRMVVHAKTKGSQFEDATFKGKLSFDALDINAMNAFVKKPAIPLNVQFSGNVTSNSFTLSELIFHLHNTEVKSAAKIQDFVQLNTMFQLNLNNDDLQSLGDLLPQHKEMLVGGNIDLSVNANGLLSDFSKLKIETKLAANLTGADLNLQAVVDDALAPKLSVTLESKKMDLNQLLGPFLPKDSSNKDPIAETSTQEPSSNTSTEPAKDFFLTEAQKALLSNADIKASINMGEILFDALVISQLNLKFKQDKLKAKLENFSLNMFQGRVATKGLLDLGANPIKFENTVNLQNIETSELIGFAMPDHRDVMKGKGTFNLQLQGQGTTVETLSKNLNGKGDFVFSDGEVKGASIGAKVNEKLNGFIGGLSINKAAEGIYSKIEKVLQNPLLKKLGAAEKIDLSAYKGKFDSFTELSVGENLDQTKSLKDAKGELEVKNGRIYITSNQQDASGTFMMESSVGLDLSLEGGGTYVASQQTTQKLDQKSQYAGLLYDDKNQLVVKFVTEGTVVDPIVKPNFLPMTQSFQKNSKALVENELNKEIDKLKQGRLDQLNQAKDKLKAEVEKKRAELEAKKQQKEKELLDQKKKKQQELEAKKKAEENKAKKRLEEQKKKEKEKVKEQLKGKIPGL